MIEGHSILAIIPARSGSKGLPGKNIRDAAGKPLIAWTIEEAKRSLYIDRLIVSSDDARIIAVAKSWGCDAPFVRPIELAQDETPGVDVVLHALNIIKNYSAVILLQATSPLRSFIDIDGCLEHFRAKGANACVSVTKVEQNPYLMYTLNDRGAMSSLLPTKEVFARRQDLPEVYALNGAIYVANCDWLCKRKAFLTDETLGFVMPQERSLDIDTEQDFLFFECVSKTRSEKCPR